MHFTQPSLSCYVTGQSLEGGMVSPVLGGAAWLSAPRLMSFPLGGHICASKRQRKRTHWLVHSSWQVMQWHQTGGKKWCYITDKATFTQATGQPSGKQGTLTLTEKTGRNKKGIVCMFGVKEGFKKRCVGNSTPLYPFHQAERTKVFCLAGKTNVHRDRKSLVWREMLFLIIMHEALWESLLK